MAKTYEEVLVTEFSEPFVKGMKDRMVASFYKYGYVKDGVGKFDFPKEVERRLQKYQETGNTEWLMDAANFAMMEFMHPKHEKAHFRATDAGESPGRVHVATGVATEVPNLDVDKSQRERARANFASRLGIPEY